MHCLAAYRPLTHFAAYSPETLCVGVARIGQEDQRIVCATLAQMAAPPGEPHGIDLGLPLHSLVIVGETHPVEMEVLNGMYRWAGGGGGESQKPA